MKEKVVLKGSFESSKERYMNNVNVSVLNIKIISRLRRYVKRKIKTINW